ncbi:5'/3'-nucleotidase sure family protein [Auricularia subglabra TFB-10046 SS5]|uniref:5'/3'-nucleotidase sure family protein n=1 Tax=Auricularia subglabra (strain TFB-10046 / SS5) TaxID=717982 RepID=J0WVP6_AURST|nr:5'/3'-nucleotidase sure family protein [Auricularia subglabra TFB-10046 SS5]
MLAIPVVLLAVSAAQAVNILMGNDDGWATSNIRAMFNALDEAGHNVVLSSPAIGMSGTSSTDLPPVPVLFGCQFGSCPPLSPAQGFNASDPRLNYVNSFPVTAFKYGLSTLAPKFFAPSGKPDLVVSGPNVGDNIGIINDVFSGTLGVACAGARAGIPSIGFSGVSGEKVSYTTLPNAYSGVYASLAAAFVEHVLAKGATPLLRAGVALNVNYPPVDKEGGCTQPKYVLSRQTLAVPWGTRDLEICGNGGRLPKEQDVMDAKGCWASVTVLDMDSKFDVGADLQGKVVDILGDLLVCLPK